MEDKSLRYKIHQLVDFVDYDQDGQKDYDFYDIFMIFVIIISLVPLAFKQESKTLLTIEIITVIIFIIDYILKWLCADYHFKDHSIKSFIKYPFSFWAIIDLLAIIPSLTLLSSSFKIFKVLRIFRSFRAIRVVRVGKIAKYSRSLVIINKVFKDSKEALSVVGLLAIAYILVSALIIFNVEPGSFKTFFDAVYWATVSLTTVGYGDIYPVTVTGRIVAMISSIFGIAIIALPAGIITAGYMNEIQEEKNNKDV